MCYLQGWLFKVSFLLMFWLLVGYCILDYGCACGGLPRVTGFYVFGFGVILV